MRRLGTFPVDCPEVGFEEITIDLLQARFWAANEALTEARIPSALPTIRE
jgi:hypothetical protein